MGERLHINRGDGPSPKEKLPRPRQSDPKGKTKGSKNLKYLLIAVAVVALGVILKFILLH